MVDTTLFARNIPPMKFANLVYTNRHLARMTQGELAKKCKVSRQRIGNVENDLTDPPLTLVLKLAKELSISLDSLL